VPEHIIDVNRSPIPPTLVPSTSYYIVAPLLYLFLPVMATPPHAHTPTHRHTRVTHISSFCPSRYIRFLLSIDDPDAASPIVKEKRGNARRTDWQSRLHQSLLFIHHPYPMPCMQCSLLHNNIRVSLARDIDCSLAPDHQYKENPVFWYM